MSKKKKKDRDRVATDLAGHHRDRKTLKPPFTRLENMAFSSWTNDRMPDILWAVLIHHGLGRERALELFRHASNFVAKNPEAHDVTISGVGQFSADLRSRFIRHLIGAGEGIAASLRPMMVFPDLPGYNEWKAELPESIPEEDGSVLAAAVQKVLWHQSEEATECRWVKVLCQIAGGKMKFFATLRETALGIVQYPNRGDLQKVRPSIRAAEIGNPTKAASPWLADFWRFCYERTPCVPESADDDEEYDSEEWEARRKYYIEETHRLRERLIEHWLKTSTTSAIDPRHEGVFGFAFYGLMIFSEIVLHQLDYSVSSRLGIRTLVESSIALAYLLKKADPKLWSEYRVYGVGQAKLALLKLQESGKVPECIDEKMLGLIANEDAWQEFVTINLGNWDSSDLRKMSEEAGVKDVYDQYYGSGSGYIHGNWAAVREVIYERCINPLHRLHRIPRMSFPKLPLATGSAAELTNRVFDLLEQAYPGFEDRIAIFASPRKAESPNTTTS